jgi:3',5'-cyclic AMP phosphodiesterase CpdA
MFVLAHLSDPHLPPMPPARWRELASKRALGLVNWHRRRGAIHQAAVLDDLTHDLKAQPHDHVAVTGDLVNISLAAEFASATAWLETLGPPDRVTVVPGNHDIYVRAALRWAAERWASYMRGDAGESGFPFVRRRGEIALVGLSTALPTAPFMATGRLGADQLRGLSEILQQLDGAFRVVLIHHPPVSAPHRHRFERLTDAAALRSMLAQYGAELVLHGHDHVNALVWLDGPRSRIPAIGVASASASGAQGSHTAAYNLYRIDGTAGAWRCEIVTRTREGSGDMRETAPLTLY